MIDKLIGPVSGILDKVIPDKDQAAKLAHEMATMADKHSQELALAQLEILKADAQGNWFQSSWRPLIGWMGGIGLGVNYMVAQFALGFGVIIPQADMSVMMPLLLGMLGMAGARSFDKSKGTDSKK